MYVVVEGGVRIVISYFVYKKKCWHNVSTLKLFLLLYQLVNLDNKNVNLCFAKAKRKKRDLKTDLTRVRENVQQEIVFSATYLQSINF